MEMKMTIKELSEKFLALKNQEEQIKEQRYDVEAEIYKFYQDQLKVIGSTSFKDETFKITITKNLSYKVDQLAAANFSELFKTKYEFNKEKYEIASDVEKGTIDSITTITPNKPTFKVERL
jgi:hypothetical protein